MLKVGESNSGDNHDKERGTDENKCLQRNVFIFKQLTTAIQISWTMSRVTAFKYSGLMTYSFLCINLILFCYFEQ